MSRVATAKETPLNPPPAPLARFWTLTVKNSTTLTGKLGRLQITEQNQSPLTQKVNGLSGNVWTASPEIDALSLMNGLTRVEGPDGAQQQLISFEIVYKGFRYAFCGGVLTSNGVNIENGTIHKDTLPPDPTVTALDCTGDTTLVEDGTWSAKAESGGPGMPFNRPKPPGRTRRHRR